MEQECSYMYLQVPQIVYYSCESIPLNLTLFCHIYFFTRTKCPSKVRFAQKNRLYGQKLSDVRLLFPPLTIVLLFCFLYHDCLYLFCTVMNDAITCHLYIYNKLFSFMFLYTAEDFRVEMFSFIN